MMNQDVVFDLEQRRIGFAPSACSVSDTDDDEQFQELPELFVDAATLDGVMAEPSVAFDNGMIPSAVTSGAVAWPALTVTLRCCASSP